MTYKDRNLICVIIFLFNVVVKCSFPFPKLESLFSFGKSSNQSITSTTESSLIQSSEIYALTYENIMKRLKLKKHLNWNEKMNYSKLATSKNLGDLISHNFIGAYFYKFDCHVNRLSGHLAIKDLYNINVLYDLMNEPLILNLLDYEQCFLMIKNILKCFMPLVSFSDRELKNLFQSLSTQIIDFLEFVLKNLVPSFEIEITDPLYKLSNELKIDHTSFCYLETAVTMTEIVKYRNVELLRVILRRYGKFMAPETTKNYLEEALRLIPGDSLIFRQIFTMLVKKTPEYFLSSRFMSQYQSISNNYAYTTKHIANMAPILRALMLIDSIETQNNFLELYHGRICHHSSDMACFKSLEHIRVLDIFVRDSNFSLISSFEVGRQKETLLARILMQFFGIYSDHYFELARRCIFNGFLPLFEVILQHFSGVFSYEERLEFLRLAINDTRVKNPKITITITLAYLEFEDPLKILQVLTPSSTSFVKLVPKNIPLKNYKQKLIRNFKLLNDIFNLLSDFPIEDSLPKMSIIDGESSSTILWPCPDFVHNCNESLNSNSSFCTDLFLMGIVILSRKFGIPIYSVSIFKSSINEHVTWNETIDFMNFMIERMAVFIGLDKENLIQFKFVDTNIV